jgi:hypothetical protein
MDWHAIGVILGGIGLIGGILGFLFKNLIEKRFEAFETTLQSQQTTIQTLQLTFQKLQSETPGTYVKREECTRCKEDWTYLQSVIDAKLDILNKKLRKLAAMVVTVDSVKGKRT